jgi:hypothetical protein
MRFGSNSRFSGSIQNIYIATPYLDLRNSILRGKGYVDGGEQEKKGGGGCTRGVMGGGGGGGRGEVSLLYMDLSGRESNRSCIPLRALHWSSRKDSERCKTVVIYRFLKQKTSGPNSNPLTSRSHDASRHRSRHGLLFEVQLVCVVCE